MNSCLNEREDRKLSGGINLLISILLLYPEINFVKVDHAKKNLHFSFMLEDLLSYEEQVKHTRKLKESLSFFKELEGRSFEVCKISYQKHEERFTQVELIREVKGVDSRELAMIVNYFHQYFPDKLLMEGSGVADDDRTRQEMLIDRYIKELQNNPDAYDLIGFRDAGRVLVFNK